MATSTADKLRIKENFYLYTLHAPANFKNQMDTLPFGVNITESAKLFDQIHWFVTNKAQLEKELAKILKLLKPGVIVWIYYPKGSSKMQTDLTRDKGWDSLLAEGDTIAWISLISFNETWSVFGFRAKNETDRKKAAKPKAEREIFEWVNSTTKEVKLPDDMATALKKINLCMLILNHWPIAIEKNM